jgi:hypothetical protein
MITLADLKQQSRYRANMENSQFVTDSELTTYINASIAELQDLLISTYGTQYFTINATFSTVAQQKDYSLDTVAPNMYKLEGVDAKINSSDFFTLRPFNFNERNRNDSFSSWGLLTGPTIRYRLVGSNLSFSPAPDGAYQIKVWYVPFAPKLAADSDTLNDYNQYSEYVIVDAAIKMMQKEESDVQVLAMQKAALIKRIVEMAQNRDAGQPESVSDIYAENNDYYFYRGT